MGGRRPTSTRTFAAFILLTAFLAVAAIAGGAETQGTATVTIKRASCGVSPRAFAAGTVAFRIANRSGRPAAFFVARARANLAASRARTLTVSLRAGAAAYSCTVAGRRVAGGTLRVSAPPPLSAEHRIGVHDRNGFGELYDRTTDARFVPRGSNYIRLGPQVDVFGRRQVYHSTFIVGEYDANRAEAALARMAASGYNVVRVFLNNTCARGCSANMQTGEISPAYVANLIDFLRRARTHGIFVLLTAEWLPAGAAYEAIGAGIRRDWFDDVNLVFLSPQGVQMSVLFWQGLIRELIRQRAPLDAVFAYSLWNEAVVTSARPPFTLSTGTVTTANGATYDMSSTSDRKRIIDDAFVYYIDQVRSAILRIDPTALVTMGFFHDTEPNPARRGDDRVVRTRAVIERSTADLVDIHPYPGDEIGLAQLMQNYGIDGPVEKPIVIGEMGASRRTFASNEDAAKALVAWQQQSCAYGIDGWLLWTWDSTEQPDLWNALSGGGIVERALAPKNRPDPCA
jgi:hypothetical protein